MKTTQFAAEADIVGHRITVGWTVEFESGESLADLPRVVLHRKTRDFEFGADPTEFAIYDSADFPSGGAVTDVDLGVRQDTDGSRRATVATTVSATAPKPFELIRRTRTVTTGSGGELRSVRDVILDAGGRPSGLNAGVTYYYQLSDPVGPAPLARSQATSGRSLGSARMLYEQMPWVHRRHDVSAPAVRQAGAIPEAAPINGQLRRFFDLFGAVTDHVRSRADGLRDLHDVDELDSRLLPHLAAQVGWELNTAVPVPQQRHEIRYAPRLYELTGTAPGSLAWFKRLTGWDASLHEFWRNVFLTNDIGNPDDPTDHGSHTLDCDDVELIAAMRTVDDTVDYTYDTDTGAENWYAHNVVGFFAKPADDESATDVAAKRTRVLTTADRFLPVNMRAVVVLDTPTQVVTSEPAFGLTATTDQGE